MEKIKILGMLFAFISIASCTKEKVNYNNSTLSEEVLQSYEGKIMVVGNEPFTSLAIMIDDSTVFTLECDKKTKTNLLKHQGEFYKIFAKEIIETNSSSKLSVNRIKKINK